MMKTPEIEIQWIVGSSDELPFRQRELVERMLVRASQREIKLSKVAGHDENTESALIFKKRRLWRIAS
jgi:hypothetical protein